MKKTDTKTKKSAKKPAIIVDLTDVYSPEDVKFEFIRAKAHAGVLTDDEIYSLVKYGSTLTLDLIDTCLDQFYQEHVRVIHDDDLAKQLTKLVMNKINPKKPWYKRFWGWITKPFKKN